MSGRILVTGSREWTNVARLSVALVFAIRYVGHESRWPEVTIVHGDAGGADALVDRLAKEWLHCHVEPHPYIPVKHHGDPRARNSEMVIAGADFCIAAYIPPKGRRGGTRDCYEKAIAAGIPTLVVPHFAQVPYGMVQEIQGC